MEERRTLYKRIFNVECFACEYKDKHPAVPEKGYFITFSIYSRIPLEWSDREATIEWWGTQMGILSGSLIFKYGKDLVKEIKSTQWGGPMLHVRAQFDTHEEAHNALWRAVEGGFGDIYCYADGKLVEKYD